MARNRLKKVAERYSQITVPIAVIVSALFLWEIAARLIGNPLFFPAPTIILSALLEMYISGEIFPHIEASLFRCLSGFLSAAVLAVPLGVMAGYFPTLRRIVDPLVDLLRPVPPLALIPLLILWLGIGEMSKVALIFIACFFPIFINTEHGAARVDRMLVRAGRLLGARQSDIVWKVIIPSALPDIFTGLRISLALSLLAIVAAELVAANKGLGFLILDAERRYDTPVVFVGIITIALLGFTLDVFVRKARERLMPWTSGT